MPTILPAAEHVLDVAVRRAIPLIRQGMIRDGIRTLEVGLAAAELLDNRIDLEDAPFRDQS